MKNKLYAFIDELTDKYVPDRLDEIVKKLPENSVTENSNPQIKSNSIGNKRKYAEIAAGIAIVAFGAIIFLSAKQGFFEWIVIPEETNTSIIDADNNNDNVIWNYAEPAENFRIAGEFQPATGDEWQAIYSINLPDNYDFSYYLVYSISKDTGMATDDIMCGYISYSGSDNSYFSMYVYANKEELNLSAIFAECSTDIELKESTIGSKSVYLGNYGNKQCAAFCLNGFNCYARMSGITKDKSLEIVKDILN